MKAIVGFWVLGMILVTLAQKGVAGNELREKRDEEPELSHKKPCTSAESARTQCLNGGVCFAVEIGSHRTAACNCQNGYGGTRCQSRAIDPDILG